MVIDTEENWHVKQQRRKQTKKKSKAAIDTISNGIHLARKLRKMGVMVEDTNISRIESDGDDDNLSNDGFDMDVDDCAFHNTGIENLSNNDNSEENNDVNYLADDWKWDHWEPIGVDDKIPGQLSRIITVNHMVSNLELRRFLKRYYQAPYVCRHA